MGASDLFDTGKALPLAALIDQFLQHLKAEKSASEHTLLNYEIDMRHWLKFLFEKDSKRFSLSRVCDLKLLREFLAHEMELYERATVGRRLSCIKGFLKYLFRERHIEKNISELITLPKAHEKLPLILKPEEIVRLIEGLPTGTLRELRNKAVLELLYSTGVRISELVALNYENIDLRSSQIIVYGKGSKERAVPLGRHCLVALKNYIDKVPGIHKAGPKTPVFMNASGKRISMRAIQKISKAIAIDTLGLQASFVSPHTFRHSVASHLLANGAGLREIQELLGHQSLVTTQKYTQVDIKRLKSAYQKAHPRDKIKGS